MSNPEPIHEKIAKLLRLAKSSNAHEAELAMQNAARLAAKHAIDLADCEGIDEVPDVIIAKVNECPLHLRREWRLALAIVRSHFHVTFVLGHGRVTFFGREEDITIATAMQAFLIAKCREGLARYESDETAHRRRMTLNKRDNYISAWFNAINAKLCDQMEVLELEHTRLAIVLSDAKDRREEAADAHFGAKNLTTARPLRKIARRDVTARIAGHLDGRATPLMNELTPPKPVQTTFMLA